MKHDADLERVFCQLMNDNPQKEKIRNYLRISKTFLYSTNFPTRRAIQWYSRVKNNFISCLFCQTNYYWAFLENTFTESIQQLL